jgi:hypothetical protein
MGLEELVYWIEANDGLDERDGQNYRAADPGVSEDELGCDAALIVQK